MVVVNVEDIGCDREKNMVHGIKKDGHVGMTVSFMNKKSWVLRSDRSGQELSI